MSASPVSALGLLREEWDGGWSEMAFREPHRSLRGLVRRYVGYRECSSAPVRRREVPTGEVSLIASFGPRIEVLDERDPGVVRHRLTSFVVPVDDAWARDPVAGLRRRPARDRRGVRLRRPGAPEPGFPPDHGTFPGRLAAGATPAAALALITRTGVQFRPSRRAAARLTWTRQSDEGSAP